MKTKTHRTRRRSLSPTGRIKSHVNHDANITRNNETEMNGLQTKSVVPKPISNHEYSKDVEQMVQCLIAYVDNQPLPSVTNFGSLPLPKSGPDLWNPLLQSTLDVFQHRENEHCFKTVTMLDNTASVCFDLLADTLRRSEWDDMMDQVRVVQQLDRHTRIVYVRVKPVWPTSARDVVLLSHVRQHTDGRYINVTRSVVHPDAPEYTKENIVRMEAGIAGLITSNVPDENATSGNRKWKCKLVQIVNGDPKGWIPKSVIRFVATQAVPASLKKVNSIVASRAVEHQSHLLGPTSADHLVDESTAASDLSDSEETVVSALTHHTWADVEDHHSQRLHGQGVDQIMQELRNVTLRLERLEASISSLVQQQVRQTSWWSWQSAATVFSGAALAVGLFTAARRTR